MNKVFKIVIILLVLGALAFVGMSILGDSQDSGAPSSGLQSTSTGNPLATTNQTTTASSNPNLLDTEQINREFVAMLLNLDAIKLNDDIFSEPAFRVLRDNSIRLNQPGNEGRPNPFAPIGIDQLNTIQNSANALNSFQDSLELEADNVSIEEEIEMDGEEGPVDPNILTDEQFEDILSQELNPS